MTSDELKTAATGFLPGAVVGATIVWLAMSMAPAPAAVPITLPSDTQDSEPSSTQTDEPENAASPTPNTSGSSRIHAEDQPAGRAVLIKRVDLDKTSWIAVRDYADMKIGNVLGAVRREPGISENVVVDLLRATEPGKQYAVVIFADNGDGAFDTKTDTSILAAGEDVQHAVLTAQTPVAPNGR